ncbi:MAG: hypothetical protein GKR94_33545 [Gammaproteobacteria bacterium]|nr:hypothetical protein [Gammaproteobacteria bacterium]
MNWLLDTLSHALNEAIAADPVAGQLAARLSYCQVTVHVDGFGLVVSALLEDGAVELVRQDGLSECGEGPPVDIEISGPPVSLLRLAMDPDGMQVAGERSVNIKGDAHKLQDLRQLLARLEFDWEEWLAKRVGDVPARQIGNALRDLQTWSRQSKANLLEDLKDYLVDEIEQVVSVDELCEFVREVDIVRDDVERASVRISRLERLGRTT